MLVVCVILAVAVVLFAMGRPRVDAVAILVLLALMLSGVLTPQEALAGFGDPVVIFIAAIFIVGEGLVTTGLAHRLGESMLRASVGRETRLIVLIMLLAGGIGAFMSSTAIAAMFIPVVLAIADRTGLNRKRLLMPLSVAALISGMMTLIATPSNMIIDNALRERGAAPLNFFSWTPFGLAVLVIGIAFMLWARPLLGRSVASDTVGTKRPRAYDLVDAYGLADDWHRLRVSPGSPLAGVTVAQSSYLYDQFGVVIVGLERHQHAGPQFLPARPEVVFQPGDAIFAIVSPGRMQDLQETQHLEELPRLDALRRGEALQEIGAAEIMLAPESKIIGKTLGEVDLPSRYHVGVLAMRHRGEALTMDLLKQPLDFGDTLLIAGPWAEVSRLWEDRENFILLTAPAEYHERLPARRLAPVALTILVAMIVAMALEIVPNAAAALLAALAMVATKCVRLEAVYDIISWKTVVLVAGMLPLATALTKTGATGLLAHALVAALGALGPLAMLVLIFLLTALVGLFISNSATAVLVAPVAIEAAQTLGVSPQAFAMVVAIACCAAYVTPVSSPVNMLVMEPAGYSFADYVKVGLPLLLLTMFVTVALVAMIYHL